MEFEFGSLDGDCAGNQTGSGAGKIDLRSAKTRVEAGWGLWWTTTRFRTATVRDIIGTPVRLQGIAVKELAGLRRRSKWAPQFSHGYSRVPRSPAVGCDRGRKKAMVARWVGGYEAVRCSRTILDPLDGTHGTARDAAGQSRW